MFSAISIDGASKDQKAANQKEVHTIGGDFPTLGFDTPKHRKDWGGGSNHQLRLFRGEDSKANGKGSTGRKDFPEC